MAISYINGTTSGNSGGNAASSTTNVAMPSGIQEGDLLIANLALEFDRNVSSVPSGWSALPGMPLIHQWGNVHIYAYYKFAGASESNVQFGWGGGDARYSLIVDAYRGVDRENGEPWASGLSANNWGFSEFAVSGVSISEDEALLIGYAAGHTSSDRDIVNTNGVMTRHSLAVGRAAASFSELRSDSGGSGSRTFNIDASTGGSGYLIALRPGVPVEDPGDNEDEEDDESGGDEGQDETAPQTPAELVVTADSSSSLALSWSAADGASTYIIERERWTGSGDPE